MGGMEILDPAEKERRVEEYKNKPWTVVLYAEDGQYIALIPELSIGTCANNRSAAIVAMEEYLEVYLMTAVELGYPIPEPPQRSFDDFIGLDPAG